MTPVSEICVFETKINKTQPTATDQRVLGLLRTQEMHSPPPHLFGTEKKIGGPAKLDFANQI